MSTAQQIEAAIRTLPKEEREKLIHDLPSILPELAADEWDRIVHDPSPGAFSVVALREADRLMKNIGNPAFPTSGSKRLN